MKQLDKDEALVNEVLEDFKHRQMERKSFENNWQLNINFYLGNQYCYISPAGQIMEYGKQYFWQEREVYNHIANVVELRLAKLSRVRPTLTVVPFSDDEADLSCARTSKKVLKAVSADIDISKILSQGTMWSEICGTVFYKIDWNSSLGKVIGIDEDGKNLHEGGIEVSVVSPFEIYPDSNTYNSLEDCNSIIFARAYHKDMVKNIWGVDVEGIDLDIFTLDNIGSLGGLGYTTLSQTMSKKLKKNQVLVLEKYEKPTIEYPNGRLIIIAGDKLLFIGELPYVNGLSGKRGFPFVRQTCMPTPNCFWGNSVIDRLIPIQRSFNAIKNRKHEFLNRLTMGIMAVEDGSVDIENLEEEGMSPGKVLIYRQGSTAPKLMDNGSVPIDFQYEENSLISEFRNISGVSDLIQNDYLTSGNISGIALQLLIEQDEVRLVFSADEIRNAAKEIAKQILRLYKQFAVLTQTMRLLGENGQVELFYFTNNDICSEDVIFETDNEVNESLAQKRSMIFEILNSGLLLNDNGKLSSSTRSKVLEQLGFGIWENDKDIDNLHKSKAERENLKLKLKRVIDDPLSVDDHMVHINEHTALLISGAFDDEKLDALKEKMLDHIEKHKEYLKQNEINEEKISK